MTAFFWPELSCERPLVLTNCLPPMVCDKMTRTHWSLRLYFSSIILDPSFIHQICKTLMFGFTGDCSISQVTWVHVRQSHLRLRDANPTLTHNHTLKFIHYGQFRFTNSHTHIHTREQEGHADIQFDLSSSVIISFYYLLVVILCNMLQL